MRRHKRSLPPKNNLRYTARWRIWRAVNGAVADAFKAHPDYLAPGQERAARESIVKRIMGEIIALELRRETAEGLSGKTSGQNNGSAGDLDRMPGC